MKTGSLIIDLTGKTLLDDEKEILRHPLVGGVILFSRNYETRSQLKSLCQSISALREAPILVLVDQEGGRVQRFKDEFTAIPSMARIGEFFDIDATAALSIAKDTGYLLATELLSVGVDLNLGPVLDLNTGVSAVIGDRAFHKDPVVVSVLAKALVQGMNTAGMTAVGKHFPGHGSITMDSHKIMAQDNRNLEEIEENDLIPFKSLVQSGIPALMAAHVIYPKIDDKPVGYSSKWLKDILRIHLAFQGVVFSDDLSMEGANISGYYPDRVLAAREAGCDFTMICNHREGVINTLDTLDAKDHQVDKSKWSLLIGRNKYAEYELNDSKWQLIRDRLNQAVNLKVFE